MFQRSIIATSLLLIGIGPLLAAPLSPTEIEFFEKKVRPVLVEHCYECHSVGKKVKGGLALDTREALLRGGDSGAAIVAREPERSKLIEAIRYKNRDLQMPPKGALRVEQIRDLETWVTMGAPDPREPKATASRKTGLSVAEGRSFWAFKPLANPPLPAVKNKAWVQSPIDAFIMEQLERTGLQPATMADKYTLIRRATFDLTGLPPTPAEVTAFVNDSSPDAFGKVVERLLASPHYGERWGRHWLDVARYADSNGLDENVAYGHAWRYRDYVIQSFNSDKPYDEFIVQQLAGDLLPADTEAKRIEQLTATGFLSLGARVLAEPDVRKMEMDIIDEQLDTLGKAFLGMTFGCCRCHDHKFDPILMSDYYALAAIFRSTRSLSDEKMGAVKFWNEHSLATPTQIEAKKKHEALVQAQNSKINKYIAEQRAKLKDELQARVVDYLVVAAELPADPDFAQVEALAKQHGLRARYLLTCRQYLARHPEQPFFGLWREQAAKKQYTIIREHYSQLFAAAAKALKEAKAKDPKATKPPVPQLADAHDALHDIAGILAIPDKNADALDASTLATLDAMRNELQAIENQTPELPAIMCVTDGAIARTLPIHLRGSYLTLGKEVERGFPQVMRVGPSPILPAKESGRLQLARWLTSGEHPLTARVMVNRLWRWHLGQGIVSSTDNFGVLGDPPSHPALLDWLARQFIEKGWSIKEMHRLIMNSSTYQMASVNNAVNQVADPLVVDPENRLWWRANVQRLEAEQIRDAMLATSGSLAMTIGGKTIPLRNRQYVFDHTSIDTIRYDSPRRTMYLPIIRNHLYDLLEQFDYPDPTAPTGSRHSTVVAPQALLMLNAPVVMQAAEQWAARLLAMNGSDRERIEQAYVLAYARPATQREVERATTFLARQPERKKAWALWCHTLLAANEFIYVR